METYVNKILFPYFFFLFWFSCRNFIRCLDFTRIAALNTTNDVTNWVTHRIFNTDLYSCANFLVKMIKI